MAETTPPSGDASDAAEPTTAEARAIRKRRQARVKQQEVEQIIAESLTKDSVRPTAQAAKKKSRHWGAIVLFCLWVVLPVSIASWYLWGVAQDQFASTVGFSVRQENTNSASDIFGTLGLNVGSSGSSDTDILYKFIQSQQLVRSLDEDLDLVALYARHWPDDMVFSLNPEGSIEDLLEYWKRMVKIDYDSGTGLIELRVLAFSALDAQKIAAAIFDKSSIMINDFSAIARADTTRYAKEELDVSVDRLKTARSTLQEFRSRNQIVNPQTFLGGQTTLLSSLQVQLATTMIDLAMLEDTIRENDPRTTQMQKRIQVIKSRIAAEQNKFGASSGDSDPSLTALVTEFERITVDVDFAQKSYVSAQAAYNSALAEAQRQSRYLAAYVKPTLAEQPEYPRRITLLITLSALLFLSWAIFILAIYALRDRR